MTTLNHVAPFADISLIAIIISWVLTAFLPIPLIIFLIVLRYFPGALTRLLSQYPLRSQWLANKHSGSSLTNDKDTSTPPSHTHSVSETSSQTLPVSHQNPTAPRHGISKQDYASPRTSQSPSPKDRGASRSQSDSNAAAVSGNTTQKAKANSNAIDQLPSAFNSPKSLIFREPVKLPSTPRRKAYTKLSPDDSSKTSDADQLATPHSLQHHRLRRRFIVSIILLGLIFTMYVFEGFAIAAAHSYAHVRVFSKVGGKGGLGNGKENERWLIPWVIYVFVQGGLVAGCVWMVWGIKREMKLSNQEWAHEKGKSIEEPNVTVGQKIQGRATKDKGETDMFLPKTRAQGQEQGKNTDEDEERRGKDNDSSYHPIFSSLKASTTTFDLSRPNTGSTSSQPFNFTSTAYNPHGEGSSQGSYQSLSHKNSDPFSTSSLSIARLHEKVGSWWTTDRSHTDPERPQQPSSNLDRWGWGSETATPSREEEELLRHPNGEERRNSWAQQDEEVEEEEEGKGKGKQKDGEDDPNAGIELTTHVPRELLTGINLGKQYHFTDGLAYPLLPISPRRPADKSNDDPSSSANSNNKPFSLPLPPQRPLPATPRRNGRFPISPSSTTNSTPRFPKTPTSPASSSTFTLPSPSSSVMRLPPYRALEAPSVAYSSVLSPHTPPPSVHQHPTFGSSSYNSSSSSSSPYTPPPPPIHMHPSHFPSPLHPSPLSSPLLTNQPPSPPPLASPLSSPFPIFPAPTGSLGSPSGCLPGMPAGKEQPAHRIPTRAPLGRKFSVGRGKRKSYRRIESGLGTVREGERD
ncbi:MAG: hypothetical protein L6R41_005235 [Letrouitia leprolyta]|nr:MAG: hypothetical protein L6R41_005235 [Letrouitia leprolyta]